MPGTTSEGRPRVAIGGISHETNTFAPTPTRLADFRDYLWLRGDAIPVTLTGTRTYVGGMLDAAREVGFDVTPTFLTTTQPGGVIVGADFEAMLSDLIRALDAARPFDAVCLELHGAGVAEGCDDIEGRILEAVRHLIGRTIPLVATLDLHGNLTQAMTQHADAVFGVHRYPHVDSFETGVKAMQFLSELVRGDIQPTTHVEWLPMMIPSTTSELEPLLGIRLLSEEWEARLSMRDCTVFHGFPMTDVPAVGVAVHAIADGDASLAREAAIDVASAMWSVRERLRPSVFDPGAAVGEALRDGSRPAIINETSDNPGGGSPGDATHLLRALVEARIESCCYGFLYDPESVRQAIELGVGNSGSFVLGGKTDTLHGSPVQVDADVRLLSDGRFTYTNPMLAGVEADLGPMARLRVGGMDVLLSSRRQQVLDPEVFLLNGIDVSRYRIVALKSAHHFRAGFAALGARIITSDAPGLTSQRIERLGHRRVRRPIWPLDPEANYVAGSTPTGDLA